MPQMSQGGKFIFPNTGAYRIQRHIRSKIGIKLFSMRSSDIAFTMGQKILCWKSNLFDR